MGDRCQYCKGLDDLSHALMVLSRGMTAQVLRVGK